MLGKSLSVLRRLLVYALPALLVLIIFFFSITCVDHTMRREAERRSQETVVFLTDYLEGQLLNTESAASVYLSSRLTMQLNSIPEEFAAEDNVRHMAYSLSADIITFCNRNNMAKDLLCYFPKLNRIVGKNGYLTPYQYYKSLYPQKTNATAGYQNWEEQVLGCTGIQFLTYDDPATEKVSAYHFQSTPVNAAPEECERVLLLLIDDQAAQAAAGGIAKSMDLDSLRMLTEDGLQYCAWQSDNAAEQPTPVYAVAESTVWRMNLEISQALSVAYRAIYTLERTLFICLLAAAALALLVCVYFLIRNSRSIQKIQSMLPAGTENETYHTTDFEWIAEKVNLLYQENSHQIEEINLQNEMLAHALLRNLIYQNVNHAGLTEQLCNVYGITLEYQNLKLLMIPVTMSYEKLQWTMHDLLNKWESNEFWFCWTKFEENCVILCNWSPTFVRMSEFINDGVKAEMETRVYESDTFFAPEEISERFVRMYTKTGRHSLPVENKPQQLSIPERFLDGLETGNYKKVRALLPEIEKWAVDAVNSKRTLCQRYAFLSRLYDFTARGLAEEELNRLFSDVTGRNWSRILYGCLLQMAKSEVSKKKSIPNMALEIIEREYSDTQLGLASISERLGVSQPYLSRIFKEE